MFTSFQTMSTRHQAEKELLGDPESVLSTQWLKAVFSGADTDGIIPWPAGPSGTVPSSQLTGRFDLS